MIIWAMRGIDQVLLEMHWVYCIVPGHLGHLSVGTKEDLKTANWRVWEIETLGL